MKTLWTATVVLALVSVTSLAGGVVSATVADPVTDVFRVEGWTRPHCDEIGVKLILESLDGVEDVEVTFESGRTEVTYDPGRIGRRTIIEEVQNLDYDIELIEQSGEGPDAGTVSGG